MPARKTYKKRSVRRVRRKVGPKKKTKKRARKQTIPKSVRDKVWNTYIGIDKGTAKCMCCKNQQIAQNNFECGHVVSEKTGGKVTVWNLRPICSLCNKSMGTKNMVKFMKEHEYDIKSDFRGRYELLAESYPNGYYFCDSCGAIKKPPSSWLSWGVNCGKCKKPMTKYSTGMCILF